MIDTCRACGGLYDDMWHCEDCESYYNVCDEDDHDETPSEDITAYENPTKSKEIG